MSTASDDARAAELAGALRAGLRNRGDGLTRPFRRTFDQAGMTPTRSIPAVGDVFTQLVRAVLAVADEAPEAGEDGIRFAVRGRGFLVRVDTEAYTALGHHPAPDVFVLHEADGPGRFTSSSPDVLARLVLALPEPIPRGALPGEHDDPVQLRAPEGPLTGLRPYVGSREWGIHSEAVGDEFVRRGVAAVAAAIADAGEGNPVATGGRAR